MFIDHNDAQHYSLLPYVASVGNIPQILMTCYESTNINILSTVILASVPSNIKNIEPIIHLAKEKNIYELVIHHKKESYSAIFQI